MKSSLKGQRYIAQLPVVIRKGKFVNLSQILFPNFIFKKHPEHTKRIHISKPSVFSNIKDKII